MRTHGAHRRRQRGQSIIELMLSAPVLAALLFGGLATGSYISDRVTAGHAVRQGGRIAAELGGTLTLPAGTTLDQVDQTIVTNVIAVAASMNFSYINEIDIYPVVNADGSYRAGDPIDRFDGSGTAISPAPNFTLDLRQQIPPNETLIGLSLQWTFNPVTGFSVGSFTETERVVFRAAPWRVG